MRKREALGIVLIVISIFLLIVCIIVDYVGEKNETITGEVISNKTMMKYNYERGELTFYEKG